jgi:hypothetical protein
MGYDRSGWGGEIGADLPVPVRVGEPHRLGGVDPAALACARVRRLCGIQFLAETVYYLLPCISARHKRLTITEQRISAPATSAITHHINISGQFESPHREPTPSHTPLIFI